MWMLLLKGAWTFLKGLPWQVYAVIAVLALGWYVEHHGAARQAAKDETRIKTLTAIVRDATDANASGVKAVEALKGSVAQCERGRLVDANAQAQAMLQRDKALAATNARYAKAKGELDALQNKGGRCAAWAAAPACGVTP